MSEEQRRAIQSDSLPQIREWRYALMDVVLRMMVGVALIVLIGGSYYAIQRGTPGLVPVYWVTYGILLLVRFVKPIPYPIKVGVLLALFYGLAILFLGQTGLSGDGRVFLVAFCFATGIFLGQKMGFVALGLALLTMIGFGIAYITGALSITVDRQATTVKAAAWLSNSLTLGLVIVFIVASLNYLLQHFFEAIVQGRALAEALEVGRAQAEAESRRTQQRAERVGWAAAFGSDIISMRRRDELTLRLVREMARTFDLYAVNLFLKAERGDVLVLSAAAGERSEVLMQTGWQIPVGSHLLPGRAAQVGTEQATFLGPGELAEFPQSRVEIALPLVTRGELLGVLDIHILHTTVSEDDLQLFRVVVDYASTALDVLRLLEESDARMQEMRALYAQYTATSWQAVLETEATESHSVGELDVAAARELAAEALRAGAPRSAAVAGGGHLLVVPLVARDLSLGYLAFSRPARRGDWDAETRTLIETAAERFALALDNTRLLIEARQKAFYEEKLGQIGDVVWSNPSVEIIMERGVEELGRFLGASEVAIYFTAPGELAEEVRG